MSLAPKVSPASGPLASPASSTWVWRQKAPMVSRSRISLMPNSTARAATARPPGSDTTPFQIGVYLRLTAVPSILFLPADHQQHHADRNRTRSCPRRHVNGLLLFNRELQRADLCLMRIFGVAELLVREPEDTRHDQYYRHDFCCVHVTALLLIVVRF